MDFERLSIPYSSGTHQDETTAAAARSRGAATLGSRRAVVTVIDDDPVMNRLVQRGLEERFEVRQEFGAPVPRSIDFSGVDLVILDYQMPIRNGLEVLAEIREARPRLPVLFLTGFDSPELAERALEAGANAFLTKPVEAAALKAAVESLLNPAEANSAPKRFFPVAGDRLHSLEQSREFRAIGADGGIVVGELLRFNPQSAVVEVATQVLDRSGPRLSEVRLKYGRQQLRSFSGVIGSTSRISTTRSEVEVLIPGVWSVWEDESIAVSDAESAGEDAGARSGAERALDPSGLSSWRRELPGAFRLATHELAAFLKEIQQLCAASSAALAQSDALLRFQEESRFVIETSDSFSDAFWELMEAFEATCEEIEAIGRTSAAKRFARRELYPALLSSPFLARIVERPIGVPGDFGMLGQILGNPHEGYSLYDRVLNSWILKSGAADAYRYRVALLEREIRRCVVECRESERTASIMSMASGVAYEVQHYIRRPEAQGRVDFSLVDFSDDTLEEAKRQFDTHGPLPEGVALGLYQSSVIDLANRSRSIGGEAETGFVQRDDYHHVYCAGLYDYLSDRLVKRVSGYLYGTLAPGGTLVLSNYTLKNPLKGLMTVVLDWELVYRTPEQFESLIRDELPADAILEIELDRASAEVYALVRKPD